MLASVLRRSAPWAIALVALALLYNALPLASTPEDDEVTWRGVVGSRSLIARLLQGTEGDRLIVTGLNGASRLLVTWLPVQGQGVIVERPVDLQGDVGQTNLLTLTADRWQLLLTLDETDGTQHLAVVDWVRGDDGVLRPAGQAPSPMAQWVGRVNAFGPAVIAGAAALVGLAGVWRVARRPRVVESN